MWPTGSCGSAQGLDPLLSKAVAASPQSRIRSIGVIVCVRAAIAEVQSTAPARPSGLRFLARPRLLTHFAQQSVEDAPARPTLASKNDSSTYPPKVWRPGPLNFKGQSVDGIAAPRRPLRFPT